MVSPVMGHSVPEAWRTPGCPPRRVAFPEVTREQWETEPAGPFPTHRFADDHDQDNTREPQP